MNRPVRLKVHSWVAVVRWPNRVPIEGSNGIGPQTTQFLPQVACGQDVAERVIVVLANLPGIAGVK